MVSGCQDLRLLSQNLQQKFFLVKLFIYLFYLQALSNLTGDPYRAHCSINRVPKIAVYELLYIMLIQQNVNSTKHKKRLFINTRAQSLAHNNGHCQD